MAKNSKGASKSVESAVRRKKKGQLKSGSGAKVKSSKQAVAIGLSEARKKGAKVPKKAGKKAATKKRATKKSATKKSATRKKAAPRKAATKKAATKKRAAKKSSPKKAAKKSTGKRGPGRPRKK